MWEALANALSFVVGFILAALTWTWRYRRYIAAAVEYVFEMFEDGRITREELAKLLKLLGQALEEAK